MRRQMKTALGALLAVGIALAASAPASAHATGSETFKGFIVTSGVSGSRVVVTSLVVARGVFNGIGRVVEVENLPGDPDNVSRDDLVFAGGSMHLVSTTLDFAFSVDPRSCIFSTTLQQTGTIVGGTGRFAAATGASPTATVRGHGLLARDPDGSCSQQQDALHELDTFASSGTLSF
jgi:hypothetical protein